MNKTWYKRAMKEMKDQSNVGMGYDFDDMPILVKQDSDMYFSEIGGLQRHDSGGILAYLTPF